MNQFLAQVLTPPPPCEPNMKCFAVVISFDKQCDAWDWAPPECSGPSLDPISWSSGLNALEDVLTVGAGCVSGAFTAAVPGIVTGAGDLFVAGVGCGVGGGLAGANIYLSDNPSDYGLDPSG
jgi:hypothetical protein